MAKKSLSQSGELIKSLQKKGYSFSAIGKAVNRDSSLVSQIAKGKKQGSNLTEALQSLLKTGKVEKEPERRKTKSGKVARVRQPSLRDEKGALVMTAPMKASDGTWKSILKQFQDQGKKVTVHLKFNKWKPYANSKTHPQEVSIYSNGRDPQAIIDSAEKAGQSIEDYLISQAISVYKPNQAENFAGLYLVEAGFDD